MIPSTALRVHVNTAEEVNEQIRQQTALNVARHAQAGPGAIDRRLHELDREWDIERCVETMAPTLTMIGLGLGLATNKKWFALPLVVQAFFLQHALQGWCPPIPLLRRLGVRTVAEIDVERNALKAIRGDYRHVQPAAQDEQAAHRAMRAAER